jgi:hypothetical protein
MVYFNPERVEVKRAAGHVLLVFAFLINIPLQAGIAVYGLVYAIRASVDGNTITGILAIPLAAACVAVAHFAVGPALRLLNSRAASLLGKVNVETTCPDQREWRRKQAEKGYFDRRRSILDAEAQHIKESLGIPGDDLARNRRQRG